jgi:hypothetical protein
MYEWNADAFIRVVYNFILLHGMKPNAEQTQNYAEVTQKNTSTTFTFKFSHKFWYKKFSFGALTLGSHPVTNIFLVKNFATPPRISAPVHKLSPR